MNLSSSGRYRCEVSGEAPSFNTVDGYGDMIVVGEFYSERENFSTNISEIEKCFIHLWYWSDINIPSTKAFLIIFHALEEETV